MTIAEYIAKTNLKGVRKFASENGYSVPNDAREAYLLLKMIDNRNPQEALKVLSKLHPDKFLFTQEIMGILPAPAEEPKQQNFSNMTAGCGCMKNATGDMTFSEIADKGAAFTENAVHQVVEKTRQVIRERNDDLVKNLLFFGAGILVAKLLLK